MFILLTYLAIGPGLAIPRTASTSFEMAVVPFVSADAPLALYQALYTEG
ncbi:MAG: branched-chain amino acid transport system II carrier protein [Coprococcus sp.]